MHVSDREDCRGQVDADWGWGRGWCGDCHGSLSLQDDDGRTFRNNGCPFDRSPQGRDLYQFYCSQNKAADLVASLLPRFKSAPATSPLAATHKLLGADGCAVTSQA